MSQHEQHDKSQHLYRASAADFVKIPGLPVAYWLGPTSLDLFLNNHSLGNRIISRCGMNTGDNEFFLKVWYEVSFRKIGFGFCSCESFLNSNFMYAPYNKGGSYRKWYGNLEYVIKFDQSNFDKLLNQGNKLPSRQYYFRKNITWSDVTSSTNGVSFRFMPEGSVFDGAAAVCFPSDSEESKLLGYLNTRFVNDLASALNPTMHFKLNDFSKLPDLDCSIRLFQENTVNALEIAKLDWNSLETSWDFAVSPMIEFKFDSSLLFEIYSVFRNFWLDKANDLKNIEESNNYLFAEKFNLSEEMIAKIDLSNITLSNNPKYLFGGEKTTAQLEECFQSKVVSNLVSYIIGCMMGRYSIDKPGLILASQGETLQEYLNQIPNPRFMPDSDAILPLTDQEWFADDVTNRVREFVKVVWGEETLQENLAFIAESLCLHAIKPKKSESALDTIRRYLSTQFYKDHLKTYKKRPIYWLFSSGKEKAFECLVYLHRYNESTLARMRTEYVTPLMGKYDAQHSLLLEQKTDASPAQQRELEKEIKALEKKQTELRAFDEQLKHYADMRIKLDLDDGVKVNYGKFGNLLAEVKAVTGDKGE